jgi:hypothetical protein
VLFGSEPRKEEIKKRNGTSRIKQAVRYSDKIDQSEELL